MGYDLSNKLEIIQDFNFRKLSIPMENLTSVTNK